MIKKISSVILAVALLVTCMTPMMVSADELINETINVDANIELKATTASTYVDGPVTAQYSSVSAIPTYDFKATLDLTNVREEFTRLFSGDFNFSKFPGFESLSEQEALEAFNLLKPDLYVTGEMIITINVPAGITVNSAFVADKTNEDMADFSGGTALHKEIAGREEDNGTITIKTIVADGDNAYVAGTKIQSDIDTYLGDISLECTANTINSFGTHTITGSVEGTTTIYLDRDAVNEGLDLVAADAAEKIGTIKYETGEVSETITVSQTPSYGGGGGGTVVKPDVTIDFSVNGDKTIIDPVTGKNGKVTVDLDELTPPEIPGYISNGKWYEDSAHTKEVSGKYTATENTTLYTSYINMTVPSVFVDDHYGYIQGYPDGEVKPNKNVSREEVAALLYRLLKEEVRESLRNNESYFADVEEDRWSHSEIAAMVKGGYIKGYDDGSFRPGNPITRAEFATLITRFIDADAKPAINTTFDDIENHWAKEYIEKAAAHMLISGYVNGSFKPDQYITRAEAVTILNNILVRHVDKEGLHEDAKHWPDNEEFSWYYYQVLEATNSHDHTRRENSHLEDWTTRNALIDWTQH